MIRLPVRAVAYVAMACLDGALGGCTLPALSSSTSSPAPDVTWSPASPIILAGEFAEGSEGGPAASQQAQGAAAESAVATTRPSRRRYTAPGADYRRISLLAGAAGALAGTRTAASLQGREVSENAVGRPDLQGSFQTAAPVGMAAGGVVLQSAGKTGLQQGAPLVGGLRFNTIFQPRTNSFAQGCAFLVPRYFPTTDACLSRFRP